ncbi:MAG: hypothetical protein H9W81_07950 [Enterococcus sp.]|nr:hypothetical protein [Enterococcus sp.]
MKMTPEAANKIFDIIATEGKHPQEYINHHREEFITKMMDGAGEHWYPTKAGSNIKMYFGYWNPNTIEVRIYAQRLNTVHDKTLVADTEKALKDAGFRVF